MLQRGKYICLMLVGIALLTGSVGAGAQGAGRAPKYHIRGNFAYTLDADGGACIVKYSGSDSSLSIPSEIDGHSVRSIGEGVFRWKNSLTEISLPEGLNRIGDFAFFGCGSLTEIALPEGLTAIGEEAFSDCNLLREVSLPDSLTTIGAGVFLDCESL